MTLYLTSDLHIGHANIIDFCDRPYESVPHMNSDLAARWNEVVMPDDTVIVVGDVCMGRLDDSLAIIALLQGHKFLVPGNHDRVFEAQGTRYREQADRYLSAGFEEIYEELIELELPDGQRAIVCHFPYWNDDDANGHEGRFPEHRPDDEGGLLVHGHQHGSWRRNDRMIDVGVDAWGGFPVSADVVAATFSSAERQLGVVAWEPRDEAKQIAVGEA